MKIKQLPFYLAFIMLILFCQGNAFFWDTIQLGSKHAHFFYENGFSSWILPEEMDSGHPPVFGAYIAVCWAVFGKSLVTSHWAMLPFLLGIVYQWSRLLPYFLEEKYQLWGLSLLLSIPVFIGQASLVSPDIVLVFGFLLALNQILWRGKVFWKILAFILLGLISTRGMMVVLGLYFFEITCDYFSFKKIFFLLLQYFPAGIITLSFLIYHYNETGWIGYHPDSPWAPAFERVGAIGFIKNMAVLGWRFLDFGMIGLWMVVYCWLLYNTIAGKRIIWEDKRLVKLLICLSLTLLPSFLMYMGLSQHRYLLPLLLMFGLWCVVWLSQNLSFRIFKITTVFLLFAFWTGHLWVYPDRISQGWDSTLGHLPFYEARQDLLNHLQKSKIDYQSVGAAAFINDSTKYMDLEEQGRGFHRMDFDRDSFVVYSNISNDYTDEQLRDLKQNWLLLTDFSRAGVKMILYKKE